MADIIGEFISKQAFDEAARFKKELVELQSEFERLEGVTRQYAKEVRVGSPEDTTERIKKYTKSLTETEKVTKAVIVASDKLVASRTKANATLQETRQETSANNKALRDNKKLIDSSKNSIERANLLIKRWTMLQSKLNLETKEGIRQNELYNKAIARQNKFRKTNTNEVEKQRLAIGNYANGNIELLQVLREFPALANSAQSFFLGISNNLPQLADRLKTATIEAGSMRKGFAKVLSGLFSFGGIVAIATTALTFLGPMIASAASSMNLFGKAAKISAETVKEMDQAMNQAVDTVAKEITQLDLLYSIATDVNANYDARTKAVKRLQQLYPKYLGNLSAEEIMAGKAADAYDKLNKALVAKALFKGFEAQAAVLSGELAPMLFELDKAKEELDALRSSRLAGSGTYKATISTNDVGSYEGRLEKKIGELTEKTKPLERRMKELFRIAAQYANVAVGAFDFGLNGPPKSKQPPSPKKRPKTEDDLIAENDYKFEQLFEMREEYWAKLRVQEEKRLSDLSKSLAKEFEVSKGFGLANLKEQLTIAQTLLESEDLIGDERIKITQLIEKLKTKITEEERKKRDAVDKKELAQKLKDLETIKQVSDAYFKDLRDVGGIVFQKEMERIGAKKKATEEFYTLEAAKIQASFQSQEEKERALGRLAIEKAARDRALADEDLRLRQRKAKFQKAADVASIISSTAIAILAALGAKPYTPANIALAAGAGATGAVQLAKALAAPIPQYAEGTLDHQGGLAVVGDGGKKEVIETPSGQTFVTPDVSTLIDLPRHSVVHKDFDSYLYKNPSMPRWNSNTSGPSVIDLKSTNEALYELIGITKRKNLSVTNHIDISNITYKNGRKR